MFRVGVGSFEATALMRQYVDEILNSGRITYGPFCQQLERAFASAHGSRHGILSNSGTSSLHVALQALKETHGWHDGDEVIVPATTFVATVNIVLHNGMVPVPVDININDYNIDVSLIARAITDRTRCIIPVHLFGQPAAMSDIVTIAKKNKLAIIEDSCETVYATHNGMTVGSFGDVACFSLYAAHHLAAGVGGIGVTNSMELATVMRSLVNHGRDGVYIKMEDSQKLIDLSRRFNFERVGHSFRITEFEAAIALAQMATMPEQLTRRRAVATAYSIGLRGLPLYLPTTLHRNTHSWMMYPIVCKVVKHRDLLTNHLEELGIETRPMLPLINQPVYEGMWNQSDYPIAQHIENSGFYIGCHPGISDDDITFVIESIKEFYRD